MFIKGLEVEYKLHGCVLMIILKMLYLQNRRGNKKMASIFQKTNNSLTLHVLCIFPKRVNALNGILITETPLPN